MRIPPRPNFPGRSVSNRGAESNSAQSSGAAGTVTEALLDDGELIPMRVDVCIYGATSAGVIAACAVSRAGHSVLLIEPGRHVGGLSTGGVCVAPTGTFRAIGGLTGDFYNGIAKVYRQVHVETYEPCVAQAVFNDLLRDHNVTVILNHRLLRAEKTDGRIKHILLETVMSDEFNAPVAGEAQSEHAMVEAGVWIDCSYEGDLLSASGVACDILPARISMSLCLTCNPINLRPMLRVDVDGYWESHLASFRNVPFIFEALPNAKSMVSLRLPMEDDPSDYMEADYNKRGMLWRGVQCRLAGLLQFLKTDSRVSALARDEMNRWSLCLDEFHDTAGWPHQLLIQGGRKLRNDSNAGDLEEPIALDPVTGKPLGRQRITPMSGECQNLLVPVCAGVFNLGSPTSLEIEPTRMLLAESAGLLAALAIDNGTAVQAVAYSDLRARLLDGQQILAARS